MLSQFRSWSYPPDPISCTRGSVYLTGHIINCIVALPPVNWSKGGGQNDHKSNTFWLLLSPNLPPHLLCSAARKRVAEKETHFWLSCQTTTTLAKEPVRTSGPQKSISWSSLLPKQLVHVRMLVGKLRGLCYMYRALYTQQCVSRQCQPFYGCSSIV